MFIFDERLDNGQYGPSEGRSVSLLGLNPDVVVATGGRVIPILMQNSA